MSGFPRHLGERQARREQILAARLAQAHERAWAMGRSIRCGSPDYQFVGRKHATDPDGCKNDGTGCICECHDPVVSEDDARMSADQFASWEVIRAAADRLEELAANWREGNAKVEARAAAGWREPREDGAYTWAAMVGGIVDDYYDEAAGAAEAWARALSPTVAEPLVAWLRQESAVVHGVLSKRVAMSRTQHALDFARAVLGSVDHV